VPTGINRVCCDCGGGTPDPTLIHRAPSGAADIAIQPDDSAGNGYVVAISGGNAANGSTGGSVTLDAGREIDGGTSASVEVTGGDGGDGGDVLLRAGFGNTAGVITLQVGSDGALPTIYTTTFDNARTTLGVPELLFRQSGVDKVRLKATQGIVTVRNANDSGDGQLIAGYLGSNGDIGAGATGTVSGAYLAAFPIDTNLDPLDVRLSDNSIGLRVLASTGLVLAPNGVLIAEVQFASLPGSPTVGQLANVSDSNTNVWGATIAGTGGNHVLARWNGSNWTVVGK